MYLGPGSISARIGPRINHPEARALFSRIDHVGIVVADLRTARRWYEERLGWTSIGDEYIDHVGVHVSYLRSSGTAGNGPVTLLQLVQPVEPGPVLAHLDAHGEGMHHVCFAVDDIDRALSGLGDPDVHVFEGGRDRLACFLSARPNGVVIELTETEPGGSDGRGKV